MSLECGVRLPWACPARSLREQAIFCGRPRFARSLNPVAFSYVPELKMSDNRKAIVRPFSSSVDCLKDNVRGFEVARPLAARGCTVLSTGL